MSPVTKNSCLGLQTLHYISKHDFISIQKPQKLETVVDTLFSAKCDCYYETLDIIKIGFTWIFADFRILGETTGLQQHISHKWYKSSREYMIKNIHRTLNVSIYISLIMVFAFPNAASFFLNGPYQMKTFVVQKTTALHRSHQPKGLQNSWRAASNFIWLCETLQHIRMCIDDTVNHRHFKNEIAQCHTSSSRFIFA